jgi:hypothetical protein
MHDDPFRPVGIGDFWWTVICVTPFTLVWISLIVIATDEEESRSWFVTGAKVVAYSISGIVGLTLAGLFYASLAMAAYSKLAKLIELFEKPLNPLYFVPSLMGAVLFYYLRGRTPRAYGVFETLVGAMTIWIALVAPATQGLTRIIGILGGIYIVVRGLDNFDKGLTLGELRTRWDRVFPKIKRADSSPESGSLHALRDSNST